MLHFQEVPDASLCHEYLSTKYYFISQHYIYEYKPMYLKPINSLVVKRQFRGPRKRGDVWLACPAHLPSEAAGPGWVVGAAPSLDLGWRETEPEPATRTWSVPTQGSGGRTRGGTNAPLHLHWSKEPPAIDVTPANININKHSQMGPHDWYFFKHIISYLTPYPHILQLCPSSQTHLLIEAKADEWAEFDIHLGMYCIMAHVDGLHTPVQ